MNNEKDWIEDEIRNISEDNAEFEEVRETRRTHKLAALYDKRLFVAFLILLLPMLSIELIARETQRRHIKQAASAQWRCSKCHTNIYSESPDWKGDYYCRRCGTRKGD